MNKFEISIPTQIIFGNGKINEIGQISSGLGSKAVIITMKDLVELDLLGSTLISLKNNNIEFEIISNVKPEPFSVDIDSLREQIRNSNADFIIGFGGGSVIDTSKALAIISNNDEPVWNYIDLKGRPPKEIKNNPLPIIAVPTTAGTGAEVNCNAVITNASTKQKATIKDKRIFPKIAIVDPELTYKLPISISAMSGIDAFAHSYESYINIKRSSDFSNMICREAISIIKKYLPEIINSDGKNTKARDYMAYASMLSGIAIAHAGTTCCHAIAQPATARLGLPHGLTVAIFTYPVTKHTYQKAEKKYAEISDILNPEMKFNPMHIRAENALKGIESLLLDVGMKQSLSQNGANESIIDELTEDTVGYMGRGLPQHPVHFDKNEIRTIIAESF